ncbi:hypothetical protein ACEF17_10780, partial [Streptococcus hyovaginalis]
ERCGGTDEGEKKKSMIKQKAKKTNQMMLKKTNSKEKSKQPQENLKRMETVSNQNKNILKEPFHAYTTHRRALYCSYLNWCFFLHHLNLL